MHAFKELQAIDEELAKRNPEFAKLLKKRAKLEAELERTLAEGK